jgi:hypothetical protein
MNDLRITACPTTAGPYRTESALFTFLSIEVSRAVSDTLVLQQAGLVPASGPIAPGWAVWSGRCSGEPVRQPVEGTRLRAGSRPVCGVRSRPRRSPLERARRRPTAPRHGSRLRLPARRQAARGPTAGASNRPTPGARYLPPRGRVRLSASAYTRSPYADRSAPQGAERHRPPLLRDRRDVVLPLGPRRTGQKVRGAGLEGEFGRLPGAGPRAPDIEPGVGAAVAG